MMLFALRPKLFLLAAIFAFSIHGYSQKSYPTDYFRPPLDSRLFLAGTFGEIRANHFHSGIDIKTGGVEGAPVYAVADGYVSRIKVSAYGFGKVMYITHPNGYVSVYGHLSKFNKAVGDYVKKEHYRRENFEIELFPTENEFPVKKGEIIAYSGNSGSSGGPHLHFEFRDGASQKPINPLLFGYDVRDLVKPAITSIKIYPEDEQSKVNGVSKAVRYLTEGSGNGYRLAGNPSVRVKGNIYFAIQVYDQQSDTDNKNGPYAISLFIDSKKVFHIQMESFAFEDTRYVNSILDYEEFVRNNVRLERTKIDPGNKIDIYSETINQGIFHFNDTLTHAIRYEVTDAAGNLSSLAFKVKSEKASNNISNLKNAQYPLPNNKALSSDSNFQISNFNYNTPNYFSNGSVSLEAPKGVFYDSFIFRYDSARQVPGTYSIVHKIHNRYTPVQDYITLSIRAVSLPETLQNKALIVKIKDDGNGFSSVGGDWEGGGYVTTKIREFGNFSIAVDTIPPKIRALHPETFAKMSGQKELKLVISDELSGIASYRGMLNGKWILMEYDAKNDLLIYTLDEMMIPGQNTLLLEVRDGKNNRAYYSAKINL
jgi:hypothetical protein